MPYCWLDMSDQGSNHICYYCSLCIDLEAVGVLEVAVDNLDLAADPEIGNCLNKMNWSDNVSSLEIARILVLLDLLCTCAAHLSLIAQFVICPSDDMFTWIYRAGRPKKNLISPLPNRPS